MPPLIYDDGEAAEPSFARPLADGGAKPSSRLDREAFLVWALKHRGNLSDEAYVQRPVTLAVSIPVDMFHNPLIPSHVTRVMDDNSGRRNPSDWYDFATAVNWAFNWTLLIRA